MPAEGAVMELDELNLSILKSLKNGRKSLKEIADSLSVAENTVRSRLNRMTENGAVDILALVDPGKIDGCQTVIIGIKLGTMDLVSKGEEFSRLRGVVNVCVVTGQYDLIATVLLKAGFGLLEFYTQEVSRIKLVQSVETFVVYKSYNLMVPYVL